MKNMSTFFKLMAVDIDGMTNFDGVSKENIPFNRKVRVEIIW